MDSPHVKAILGRCIDNPSSTVRSLNDELERFRRQLVRDTSELEGMVEDIKDQKRRYGYFMGTPDLSKMGFRAKALEELIYIVCRARERLGLENKVIDYELYKANKCIEESVNLMEELMRPHVNARSPIPHRQPARRRNDLCTCSIL